MPGFENNVFHLAVPQKQSSGAECEARPGARTPSTHFRVSGGRLTRFFRHCAGSTLIIVPWFLQTSARYYDNPNVFDPDNFLPDRCRDRHPYAYIPFSAGYRNCIGIKYGMFQMKTVVSTLVRHNVFRPSDRCPMPSDLRLMFLITLKFVEGCYVKVIPRTP